MRSISLPKPALVAALACIALSGCAAQEAIADHAPAGSATQAATRPDTPSTDNYPELSFLELMSRITQSCDPDAPQGSANGEPPRPEDLPGWEGSSTPSYAPGQTPPSAPSAEGGIPVPLPPDAPAPPESTPPPAKPKSVKEVPLSGIEKCSGDENAKRISEAFKNTKTTSYQAMHKKLTGLDYPASRIHQMPNRAGVPRARLDLRILGSHLVLEVTGTSGGVIVETFGAPETEDVKVTDVKRKPNLDAPTS